MEKKQDSGLSCFMIVMKFHGIPITKEQAETLSVLDPEQKTGEIEIIESAKKLKMRAKLCKLNLKKLKDVKAPIIAKNKNDVFFIVAKSQDDKFMVLFTDKAQPEIKSREELDRNLGWHSDPYYQKRNNGQRSGIQLQVVYTHDTEIQKGIYTSTDSRIYSTDFRNPYSRYDSGRCG